MKPMAYHSLIAIPILLILLLGNPVTLKAESTVQIEGNGIYRPFTLIRKVKLATAYLVDPSLPNQVEIINAYNPTQVLFEAIEEQERTDPDWLLKQFESGELKLSLKLYAEGVPSLSNILVGDSESFENGEQLKQWYNKLSDEQQSGVFLLGQKTPFAGGEGFVSWDPNEAVTVEAQKAYDKALQEAYPGKNLFQLKKIGVAIP